MINAPPKEHQAEKISQTGFRASNLNNPNPDPAPRVDPLSTSDLPYKSKFARELRDLKSPPSKRRRFYEHIKESHKRRTSPVEAAYTEASSVTSNSISTKDSFVDIQRQNTATSYHRSDFEEETPWPNSLVRSPPWPQACSEDEIGGLPDLRITINNNRAARKPSTIGDFMSEVTQCKEGNFCRHIGTNRCHCFKTEKDADSVTFLGTWQRQEAFEIPETTDDESSKAAGSDWVVSSIAHQCRDCRGVHLVPDDNMNDKGTISTTYLYPESEHDSEIFETATEAFSGSEAPLVIDENTAPDVHEEAFVTPMELVDGEQNLQFVAPEIILVEEIITIEDEPDDKTEEDEQDDQTIKVQDPLDLDVEENWRTQLSYPNPPWYWKESE